MTIWVPLIQLNRRKGRRGIELQQPDLGIAGVSPICRVVFLTSTPITHPGHYRSSSDDHRVDLDARNDGYHVLRTAQMSPSYALSPAWIFSPRHQSEISAQSPFLPILSSFQAALARDRLAALQGGGWGLGSSGGGPVIFGVVASHPSPGSGLVTLQPMDDNRMTVRKSAGFVFN